MVLAVSDSDVLIHFAKLNQLKLLKNQFSKIFLSEIVYSETISEGIRNKTNYTRNSSLISFSELSFLPLK